MSFFINPYTLTKRNLVSNGDFSNLTGLTIHSGEWYGGVPASWQSESSASSAYSVKLSGGKYYANLNQLSQTEVVGNTATVFKPLYQAIAALPIQRTLTATLTVISLTGAPYSMGVALYVGPYTANNILALYNSPFDAVTRTITLVANNAPANAAFTLAVWQAGNTAPGVTDVTLYAD